MLYYSLYSFLLGSPTSPNSMYTTTILPSLIWWLRDFGVGGLLESNLGLLLRRPSRLRLLRCRLAQESVAGFASRSALAKLFVWPSSYFYSREARSKKPLVYIRYQEIDFSLELFWMLSFLSVLSSLERRGGSGGRREEQKRLFFGFSN